MEACKSFILALKLKIHDLLFLLCIGLFVTFVVAGPGVMSGNPIRFSPWLMILLFSIFIVSICLYIFFEYKNGNKTSNVINIFFVALIGLSILSICVEPSIFQISFLDMNRVAQEATFTFSSGHYMFFSFYVIMFLLSIYVALFIVPKRHNSKEFIVFINYVLISIALASIIYSYVTEFDNYIQMIKEMFVGDFSNVRELAPKSFFGHRNGFGSYLMTTRLCCLINHRITKKNVIAFISLFLFINMCFTFDKTAMAITLLIYVIYFVYRMIVTLKEKRRRNVIAISSVVGVLTVGFTLLGISVATEGRFIKPFYSFAQTFMNMETVSSRFLLWNNVFSLMKQSPIKSFVIGRGFGVVNTMLYPMDVFNNDPVFSIHNGFVALLGQGGIIYFGLYVSLIVYATHIISKNFNSDRRLYFALSLSLYAFIAYSLMESVHFVCFLYIFYIFIHNEYLKNEKIIN